MAIPTIPGASGVFRTIYDLAFEVSPIILTGGIASGTVDNMLPILAIMGLGFLQGLLSSGGLSVNDFPARFFPIPGGTLIANQAGEYPFANQVVAANAMIEDPLNISLEMISPVKDTAGYLTKMPFYIALQGAFKQHNASGGLYHVMTPAFPYMNCVMVGMTDITDSGNQKQIKWQLDFRRPLVTQQEAINTLQNGKMSLISGGGKITSSSVTGPAPVVPYVQPIPLTP